MINGSAALRDGGSHAAALGGPDAIASGSAAWEALSLPLPLNVRGAAAPPAAKADVEHRTLPPGTRIAAAAEGNIIDGAPKIEHAMPMGAS